MPIIVYGCITLIKISLSHLVLAKHICKAFDVHIITGSFIGTLVQVAHG